MHTRYKTINTFTMSPSPTQIISYIVLIVEIIIYYWMIMGSFTNQITKIVFTVLFSASLVAFLIPSIYCSVSDPSDRSMITYRNQPDQNQLPSSKLSQMLYCQYCASYVQMNSRHCKQCQRCVQDFDHHCIWINNCIGSINYRGFMVMISLGCVNFTVFLVSVLMLSLEDQWEQYLGYMVTVWVFAVVIFVLSFMLFNLFLLHIYLMCKGYTTYQFIVSRRQQQRLQKQKQAQRNRQKSQKRLPHSSQTKKTQIKPQPFNKQQIYNENLHITNQDLVSSQGHCRKQEQEQRIQQIFQDRPYQRGRQKQKEKQERIYNDEKQGKIGRKGVIEDKDGESDEYIDDRGDEPIRMSAFFTKNRSLEIFVGKQLPTKPSKKMTLNPPSTTKTQTHNRKPKKKLSPLFFHNPQVNHQFTKTPPKKQSTQQQ